MVRRATAENKTKATAHKERLPSLASQKTPTQDVAQPVLALQTAMGNQALQSLLRAGMLRAKLKISLPGDQHEREAEQVADQVMRATPSVSSATKAEKNTKPLVTLQRASAHSSAGAVPPVVHQALHSPGQPLDAPTRTFMESRFGVDFSHVRVHTDTPAAASAQAVNARAYTVGRDIVFDAGQYAPKTVSGRQLLAHELTHVVQHREHRNIISCWSHKVHEKITTLAAKDVIDDPWFIYSVSLASPLTDYKTKRLLWTGPRFLAHIVKGEGPEHGEDGNYTEEDENLAKAQNVKVQKSYLERAVERYRTFKKLEKEGKSIHTLGPVSAEITKALGDACHIAEDRGSHWEGVKGKGHDDPRTEEGWNPDNPTDNNDGYDRAIKNTRELFTEWKQETSTVTTSPQTQVQQKPLKTESTVKSSIKDLQAKAQKPYMPGTFSKKYWMLPAHATLTINRSRVNWEIDKRFQRLTGVKRKLNWNDPKDRKLARMWLLIRDEVMFSISTARQALHNLQGWATLYWSEREESKKETKFGEFLLARISEKLGGAELPDVALYDQLDKLITNAWSSWHNVELSKTYELIKEAEESYNNLARLWAEFISSTAGGAKTAATILEITRDVSFTIAAAIATGGTSTYFGVGTVGKAFISAGYTTLAALIKETATRLTELSLEMRKEFGTIEALTSAGKEGVSALAGDLTSELLAGRLSKCLPSLLSDILAELPASLLEKIVEDAIEAALSKTSVKKSGETKSFWNEFFTTFYLNLLESAVLSVFDLEKIELPSAGDLQPIY